MWDLETDAWPQLWTIYRIVNWLYNLDKNNVLDSFKSFILSSYRVLKSEEPGYLF